MEYLEAAYQVLQSYGRPVMKTWAEIFKALDDTGMHYEISFTVSSTETWQAQLSMRHGNPLSPGTIWSSGYCKTAKGAAKSAANKALANYHGG